MKKTARRSACLLIAALLCAACLIAGSAGAARADDAKLFFLSPTYAWYFPTSSKAKNAFGSTWEGFGVTLNMETFGWTNTLRAGDFRLHPYFGYFHASEGPNDAYVIPVGLEGRWHLDQTGPVQPYIGLGVAGYAVSFEDKAADIDTGWRGAFGGRVMIGADITKWFNLQASYNLISEVKGYDLSGFAVQAKVNLYF